MGVCGTDISCYLGKFPFFDFPRIPGHELGIEVCRRRRGSQQRPSGRQVQHRTVHELRRLLSVSPRGDQLLPESKSHRRDV